MRIWRRGRSERSSGSSENDARDDYDEARSSTTQMDVWHYETGRVEVRKPGRDSGALPDLGNTHVTDGRHKMGRSRP